MTRIQIDSKELEGALSVRVEPGDALLVGRAPDPSRIEWSALGSRQSPADRMNDGTAADHYRIETMAVQSGRVSANHLLILRDAEATAVYDLGSRNGSWVQLQPRFPVVFDPDQDVAIALAGTPPTEPRLPQPKEATWTQDADFAGAVEQALVAWLVQVDAPIRLILHPPSACKDGFPLADDSHIEVQEYGTLRTPISTLLSLISEYIHAQNVRFMQLQRRVSGMVAASPEIREILLRTADSAASGRRTLFLGPTGVGKELLARSYHGYSLRHQGPFVTVNCALLDKDLLYAQLFGARRGSFTGAVADVPGLIEAANGGTLFLDELGEMNLEVQKALLRFLDSRGEYYRLGESRMRRADVQVIGASNAPIGDPEYRAQRFRDDLWYRLASSVIVVPPLHERPEDIRAYLSSRMLPGSKWSVAESLTEEALAVVLRDPWPGNFRDLENFIDRLPRVSAPRSISRQRCEAAIQEGRPTPVIARSAGPSGPPPVAAAAHAAASQPPRELPARPKGKLHAIPLLPANTALGWERIVGTALQAFLADQGEEPAGWDQLLLLVERYLKPMFVAHASAPAPGAVTTRPVNYSALARRLHIGDGSTVKTHLTRFEERFARSAGAADAEPSPAAVSLPPGSD